MAFGTISESNLTRAKPWFLFVVLLKGNTTRLMFPNWLKSAKTSSGERTAIGVVRDSPHEHFVQGVGEGVLAGWPGFRLEGSEDYQLVNPLPVCTAGGSASTLLRHLFLPETQC